MKKTQTKKLDIETAFDPDDQERDAALLRGHIAHDALDFFGTPLRPMTAATMALLQITGNRLIYSDTSRLVFDAASFILIHTDDDKEYAKVRREAFGGDWVGYVLDWLESKEDSHAQLTAFAPKIAEMMNDYGQSLTKALGSYSESGNAGGRIG